MLSKSRLYALLPLVLLVSTCGGGGETFDVAPSGIEPVVESQSVAENHAGLRAACGKAPDHVVFIDDFQYHPPNLTVSVGETVAWVNLESCGDMAAEQLAVPLSGCDNHHEVVTFPAVPGGESVNSGPICAPTRGVAPPEGAESLSFPIDVDSCADEGESNVFCHTFREPGTQHYTCFTNPAHAVLLHGVLTVTE